MAITTIGLKTAAQDLEKDVNKAIEQEFRSRALKAFADVKLTTPVDTGQARNSWYIGYTETYYNQNEPDFRYYYCVSNSQDHFDHIYHLLILC